MKQLIKYDGKTTYIMKDGKLATPDILVKKHPVIYLPDFYIEVEELTFLGYHNINVLRSKYEIDDSITEEEAVRAIEDILNNPFSLVPSAEERIAAALEFQSVMLMEDLFV